MTDEQNSELLRLHVLATTQEMAAVEQFRAKRGFPSRKAAVLELLRIGMSIAPKPTDDDEPKWA